MDLKKLKQMNDKNKQVEQQKAEDLINIPITEWKSKLNSEAFETKLQKILEEEVEAGDKLWLSFAINNKSDVKGIYFGKYCFSDNRSKNIIIEVDLKWLEDTYNLDYSTDDITKLAKLLYNMVKDKLNELGFIIIKEDDHEIKARYNEYIDYDIYLDIK